MIKERIPFFEIRKSLNISQISMAKKLKVSISTYTNWEKEVSFPNEENREKVKEILNIK